MTDDQFNKMEEYFRKSMDKFDESPSDQVWDDINARMTLEQTPYLNIKSWIFKLLPVIVVSGVFLGYYNHSQNEIKNLEAKLIAQVEGVSLQNHAQENQSAKHNNSIEPKTKNTPSDKNTNLSLSKNTIDHIAISKKGLKPKSVDYKINHQTDQSNSNYFTDKKRSLKNLKNVNQNLVFENASAHLNNDETNESVTPSSSKNKIDLNSFKNKKQIYNPDDIKNTDPPIPSKIEIHKLAGRQTMLARNLSLKKITLPNFYLLAPKMESKPFKPNYQFGITARVFKTETDRSNNLNIGYGIGFGQQIKILNRLFLTNMIRYTNQRFRIGNNNQLIDDQVLQYYPATKNIENQVTGIEIENEYLDCSLGLKYNFVKLKKGASIFINPNVIWQLHFPQIFTHTLTDNTQRAWTAKTYYGYLAAYDYRLGIAFPLSKNTSAELSLFNEIGIVRVGLENDKLETYGINFSLYFGK